jgi:eukaryotic-like serine/threonine-protein kinase
VLGQGGGGVAEGDGSEQGSGSASTGPDAVLRTDPAKIASADPDVTDATVCRSVGTPSESVEPVGAQQVPSESRPIEGSSTRLPYAPIATGHLLGGRYRLERKLGEGGMGVVYLASDQEVKGEIFAIKVLTQEIRERPDALELLREEVRKTRALAHPNIVGVYSLNVDRSDVFILMECLEGKTLQALLDEDFGRGMRFDRAWPIIEDLGAALAYAHDHSVIHGDLKPANVFVTTSGKAKLLDFGIARAARGPRRANDAAVLGALTPAYASCQMLEGIAPDTRDDIYAFACMIYEMLSGRHPFGGRTAVEARDAAEKPIPIAPLSDRQNAALVQALAFDRAARTATVEMLLAGLTPGAGSGKRRVVLSTASWVPALLVASAVTLAYFAADKFWLSKRTQPATPVALETASRASAPPAAAGDFIPPPHSIAVLPFVNMSGDVSQEYFSDGLTEELLNSLARINELQVAARTSAFSFKGKDTDVATIARKLNVGSVLEGSVRRSTHTVRIAVQLINAITGFHLWSQTYDRDLGDVLKLQTEIANAVASALKVTLLGDPTAKIEMGGTNNPAAFDAYLRGSKAHTQAHGRNDLQNAIAAYTDAIRMDPNYALAFAGRSFALTSYAGEYEHGSRRREAYDHSLADARQALALAPELAEGHLAMAQFSQAGSLDFTRAIQEYDRAVALAPGRVQILRAYGRFATWMGHSDAGIAVARRAIVLDPLNRRTHDALGQALFFARRYEEAIAVFQDSITLDPEFPPPYGVRGFAYYALGNFAGARASCESKPDFWISQVCLIVTYDKLGRHADAEALLAKFRASNGDSSAYQYAQIYAQWGDIAKALEGLDTAVRVRDPGLVQLKTDPLLDPLRAEPRFQAIERALRFPS